MSEHAEGMKGLSLDELCAKVDFDASLGCTRAATQELIRRAMEMEAHLPSKQEEPVGPPPMPEPVEIWLGELGHGFAPCGPHHPTAIGPYQIIPGMMNLDELAKRDFYIAPNGNGGWYVCREPGFIIKKDHFNTALEAQWAATQLAKEKVDE